MQKAMSREEIINDYLENMERIFDNKLEYNGDNKKAIEEVKAWVVCEWQCNKIEDMTVCKELLDEVPVMAARMIRDL